MGVEPQELVAEYGDWTRHLIPLCNPHQLHRHRLNGVPFTCEAQGKIPTSTGWVELAEKRRCSGATTDEISAEISNHLNKGGNCGLAVPPGVIVLDADSERDAAQLAQACPDAPFQRTSRGGHAVLLLPSNLEISNRCRVSLHSELQVDLRAYGTQIVCWPSIHHSGAPYIWKSALPATPRDLPELPAVWISALRSQASIRGTRRSAKQWQQLARDGVREGERHESLCSLSGKLFGSNIDPKLAYELLHAWSLACCRPPLPFQEADALICDIAQRETAKRKGRIR